MAELLSLEDERAVAAVILRYGTGIDTRDWALFRSCFTDDFQADYGVFGGWNSGDDITQAMEQMHAPLGLTLHRITNIVASAVPGGAKVRSYVDAILTTGVPGEAPKQGIGFYEDELVTTVQGWKIRRRRFVAVHLVT